MFLCFLTQLSKYDCAHISVMRPTKPDTLFKDLLYRDKHSNNSQHAFAYEKLSTEHQKNRNIGD